MFKSVPVFLYPYILKYKYYRMYNRKLDLKNPIALSEKLQWLKLHENNPKKQLLSDKLALKDYVKKQVPSLHVAEVYQVADSFNNLNFDKLPNSFVIKTNHSWHTNVFITNKEELTESDYLYYSKYYENALKINYGYWSYYELHYKKIKPLLFVEELLFLQNINTFEYEVYCINGKVEFVRVVYNFFDEVGHPNRRYFMYDKFGKKLNFALFFDYFDIDISLDLQLFKNIVDYSEILAKDVNFVRVDFIEVEGKLSLLEMTFTPFSGFIEFEPKEYDKYYGEKLVLPNHD